MSFPLRHKVVLLASVGVLAVGAMTAGVLLAGAQVQEAQRRQVAASSGERASALADMMHDAIRGDVFAAALLGDRENSSLQGSTTTLREALIELQMEAGALDSRALQQAVDAAVPAVEAYVESAQAAEVAIRSGRNTDQAIAELDDAYTALVEPLAEVSESFAGVAAETTASSASALEAGRNLLLIFGGIALLILLGIAANVVRRIRISVTRMQAALHGLAQRDLSVRAGITGDDEMGQMSASFDQVVSDLRSVLDTMSQNAIAMASSAEQLRSAGDAVEAGGATTSEAARVAANSIDSVSSSATELAAATEEVTASAREIAGSAEAAVSTVFDAVTAVERVSSRMSDLVHANSDIKQVGELITHIASQTDLLALNATIEAARAGEAGRGFAVVAEEVKELASQTAAATDDILAKVEAVTASTEAAQAELDRMRHVIESISDTQATIASAVSEQSSAMNEIARTTTVVASDSQAIYESVARAADAAQDQLAEQSKLVGVAEELSGLAEQGRALAESFTLDAREHE